MNCFESGNSLMNIFGHGEHEKGLYNNQLGAIGAAMGHFSVRNEPVLITMPTGTGKSAVMVVLSYIFKAKKVLVITPSQLVRKQIAETFREPKLLIRNNILPKKYLPKVYELSTEETSKATWDKILQDNDVCVAIPGTLNKIIGIEYLINVNAFDIVFVDEAHHSRAQSWTNILGYFKSAKQILLTATPFRRDKKEIMARLIYNYPLKRAYEEGLFSKIRYIAIKREVGMSDEDINIAIAMKTEEIYKARAFQGHRIIIRTDSRAKAAELDHIYKNNTKLKLAVIYSGLADSTIEKRILELTSGSIDGIICVDMMGEGYDFPALKIAAIHVPHKSLSITLQFVGRIARTNIEEAKIATVIASEQDFAIESEDLYKENSDWAIILPDLHYSKIAASEVEQHFADSFETVNVNSEELVPDTSPLSLTLDNFLPFFHVKLYRIFNRKGAGHKTIGTPDASQLIDIFKEIDFSKGSGLSNPVNRCLTISRENNVAIHVVAQTITPPWVIDDDSVKNIYNELVIIYFNEANSILFICSTLKDITLYEHITASLLGESGIHEMIFLPQLKRAMAGWKDEKMYNIGLKSRKTKGNDEAYKQLLGPLVQKGVLPSDKFGYTRGHSFGGAFDTVLDKNVLLGVSTSSKIWSLDEKKVVYLISWCNDIARKVGDPEMDTLKTPLSDLDAGTMVERFPDESIFFSDWAAEIYAKNTMVGFIDEDGEIIEQALLCSCRVIADDANETKIVFRISKGSATAKMVFEILPVVTYSYANDSPARLSIKNGFYSKDLDEILDILKEDPIHVYYENLSFIAGKVLFESKLTISVFPLDNILKIAWPTTVNVNKEFWMPSELAARAAGGALLLSIHEYILAEVDREFDAVFYDHGSLEIADIVAFKSGLVRFYHCKKQDSDQPRCSVDDMYEVIGQAVKSVNWANRRFLIQQLITRSDKNGIVSKVKKGTIEGIKSILNEFDNPIVPVEIIIVQPGLKSDNHTGNQVAAFQRINTLLAGAHEYLGAVSSCKLKVMCS